MVRVADTGRDCRRQARVISFVRRWVARKPRTHRLRPADGTEQQRPGGGLVRVYTPRSASTPTNNSIRPKSKYEPPRVYLSASTAPAIRLTFAEIEHILGAPLPSSARQYRPWWAKEREGTHIHARAWI